MKVTLSVIKADVGGLAGHSRVHPDLKNEARLVLENARDEGKIIDFYVTAVGDDLQLIITHNKGEGSPEIHKMAWDAFIKAQKLQRN
jgi:Archaeal fructose 1,6-bisphosphatase